MIFNVTQWLDSSAERWPEGVALIDADGEIPYREYRARALAVARAIVALGLGRRLPVAVYLPKSSRVLVSFAGAAYAGCFYSPIDVDMPEARARKIVEILRPAVVITDSGHEAAARALCADARVIVYDDIERRDDDEAIVLPIRNISLDTDLLYVLFTSGSTGTPKGVCVAHRSVVDYIDWAADTFAFSHDDVLGNQAPFYFDNSILDIYSATRAGATVCIVPVELFAQTVPLLEYLREKNVTTIFWVPSAMIVVAKLEALGKVDLSNSLKRVMFCGEVMPNSCLNVWRRHLPNCTYANLYGPTEITDACTYYIVDRDFADDEPLPIGVPTRNTEIVLIDDEICVRGTCLAAGYYGNAERTAAAFVQDPRNTFYEEKIYRTGDLARYNERGELICMGRRDHQIKHLGHRIELGEIETAVSSLPGVTLCCCLYDTERSRITLFVEGHFTKKGIRTDLRELLPDYMLPGRVVSLDTMPLNANGKIDRTALKGML